MSVPIPPSGSLPRLAAIRDRLATPGRDDAGSEGFEALLSQALRRPAAGGFVSTLPTGAAAEQWAQWQRPANALGAVVGESRSGVGSAAAVNGIGSLDQAVAALLPGATGEVFAQATTAGEAVINTAAEYLGVPYLWGGTDAEKGFDCSGLIQQAYRDIGVELPKWSRHQATMGVEVPSIDEALPGDIIAFGEPVDHVGLYVGDGQMLHAPRSGDVVKIGPIQREITTIRRVVAADATLGTPAPLLGALPPGLSSTPDSVGESGAGIEGAPWADEFRTAGARWGVDPALLVAVAQVESAFDPAAVSSAGAQGLMQFMPATAAEMGVDPWDPASAIDGAARYLRTSLDRYQSTDLALASYNAGRGAVDRYGGIPPYSETQNYVRKVLTAWRNGT
jgi:cell wall-associated NlpC family hydrolase